MYVVVIACGERRLKLTIYCKELYYKYVLGYKELSLRFYAQ